MVVLTSALKASYVDMTTLHLVNQFGYPGTVFLRRAFRRPCCAFCFGVSWKLAS